ncbi:hypothetical protein WAJ70_21055, partial [Acinetobacter baumannii]
RSSVICLAQTGHDQTDPHRCKLPQLVFFRASLNMTVRFLSLSIRLFKQLQTRSYDKSCANLS